MTAETQNVRQKKKHPVLKVLFKIWLVLFVIGCVAFFSVGNFVYSFALLRNSAFSMQNITSLLSGKSSDTAEYSGASEEKSTWLEANGTDKYITSSDSLRLHAFFAENQNSNHRFAIVCHGYSSKASHMSYFAKMFYDRGFSVLVPDARAHGESEGNVRGMGYTERRDIILWINEILKFDSNAEIVLYGVSMGGATVLMTSGESDLPKNVKAVVSDCAYTSVYDEIGVQVKRYTSLPPFPIVDSASVISEIRGGYSFRDASCVDAVKRSITPTLFIHGSADGFVPFYMLDELYSSAVCEKEKLVIEGAGHAASVSVDSETYWEKVFEFISKH